MKVTDQQFYTF